jgi:hypothetical protein
MQKHDTLQTTPLGRLTPHMNTQSDHRLDAWIAVTRSTGKE